MPIPVLYVHHRSELGGAPTSLSYLIERLDRTRIEPHVYCPPGAAAELFERVGAVVHTGSISSFTHIWASEYRGRRWLLFARELLLAPGHIARLHRLLRQHRFALVHLNDSPLILAAWLTHRAGIPLVWHLRSSLPGGGADLRSRAIRRIIRHFAAASIAINDDVARVFDVGSEVVPNSVDLDRFHPRDSRAAKQAFGVPPDAPVVAYFGFIYPSKGFREFIEAAVELRRRGFEAKYVIVGGAVRGEQFFRTLVGRGLQFADLARNYEREAHLLVRELDLVDEMRFVPFTMDPATVYAASDVVVAPSRGPELGRPVIEAAASGVPVVATGSQEGAGIILGGETGVLVHPLQVDFLADAIGSLLQDAGRRERLGRAARAHAEQTFDPARNARRIEQIYASILPAPERIPILYVHHRPQLGGAPSSLAHLIKNLDPQFEPHVLTPDGPAAALFAAAGATVHVGQCSIFAHVWDNPYQGLRWLILSRELWHLPGHLRQLSKLMRRYRFPIVHLNDSPLLPAAWMAHRRGARVVWHLRSALAAEGRDRRSRVVARLIDRWGDAAIAIDRDVAARFPIRLPLQIVHNSVTVPTEQRDAATVKARLGLPVDRVLVGFAGFIRRPKGWPQFVAAARLLIDQGARVHFVIMGGGVRPPEYFRTLHGRILSVANVLTDEETAIREQVLVEGLESHFSFLPFTPDTGEIYGVLDIIAFPNQGVGLGRPVLEAAMYGKPVIASGSRDGGGVLIPGRTGLLVSEPTSRAIADALRTLIDDPGLRERLGRGASEHASTRFDPVRNARKVEDIYRELLGIANPLPADAPGVPLVAASHE